MTPDYIIGVLETAKVGAYVMSTDQTILFWNREAERILGYSADQVVGRRCYEVLTGLLPGGFTPACLHGCPSIRALQAGQLPHTLAMRMLCASGERKATSVTPMVVAGAGGAAPVLVHLFDESPGTGARDRASDGLRRELSKHGAAIVSDSPVSASALSAAKRLSPRELEVLRLVSLGRGTVQIAEELGISPHTVRNHVRNLRYKLGADNKLAAVLTALRLGILDWD